MASSNGKEAVNRKWLSKAMKACVTVLISLWAYNSMYSTKEMVYMRDLGTPHSWPLFILTQGTSTLLRYLADLVIPMNQKVFDDYLGLYRSQVMYAVSRLEVPNILITGPKTIEEIASSADESLPDNMLRLLRAAKSFGYFSEDLKTGTWSNNHASSILRTDHPNSVASVVRHWTEDCFSSWGRLYDSIKTNENVFQPATGYKDLWAMYRRNPKQEIQFGKAMESMDSQFWYGQVYDYNWGQHRRIIDFGGNLGHLLAHVLVTYPSSTGVLFDQKSVIVEANQLWSSSRTDILPRAIMKEGSFFEPNSFPDFHDGDAIMMRMILHDWTDDQCIQILTNIRKKVGSKKVTLALVEISLTPADVNPRYMLDMHMQVLFTARERYSHHWEYLMKASGFKLTKIVPTRSIYSVIIGRPV